ncbi:MAG: NAD-dependent epimerase/dehydratase family protein, partial [Flavobacteriales bacterium]|nr:NAD-dependent epimerase/dehydratase family protein [Flavobacteriales bacterium]
MARVLVTGGAGFIGSELVIKLAHAGHQVVAVDDLTTGDLGKLPLDELPGAQFIKCDVNRFEDISSVFYAHRPEYVFHYAAVVGVKRTIENPVMV